VKHETSYILYLLKQQKILYNIDRVAAAEKDIELFKKLESSDIWKSSIFIYSIHKSEREASKGIEVSALKENPIVVPKAIMQ
jgi:hypothetical protein